MRFTKFSRPKRKVVYFCFSFFYGRSFFLLPKLKHKTMWRPFISALYRDRYAYHYLVSCKKVSQQFDYIHFKYIQTMTIGVSKPAWNDPKTSQAKPSQADLAWLVLHVRDYWLGLAWLVNSRRGHWLGFDLVFGQATQYYYIIWPFTLEIKTKLAQNL